MLYKKPPSGRKPDGGETHKSGLMGRAPFGSPLFQFKILALFSEAQLPLLREYVTVILSVYEKSLGLICSVQNRRHFNFIWVFPRPHIHEEEGFE